MIDLSKKIGEMNFDGLFTGLEPAQQVQGGVIRKAADEADTQSILQRIEKNVSECLKSLR